MNKEYINHKDYIVKNGIRVREVFIKGYNLWELIDIDKQALKIREPMFLKALLDEIEKKTKSEPINFII